MRIGRFRRILKMGNFLVKTFLSHLKLEVGGIFLIKIVLNLGSLQN